MLLLFHICTLLSIALVTPLYSQHPVSWRDRSPHTTRFVTVSKDVRLEVLDWGGKGNPVVFLAGGGDTAHVFDEFAPKLTASYRVYGITRRGFGVSSYSPLKNGADSLGEDVLAVIHALKLKKPVLVGHSFGGIELSSVANLEPKAIAAVIYLDAALPCAFDNGTGPTMKDFLDMQRLGPEPPHPSESDLASFSALEKWGQAYGLELPESEFRQTWESTSDGRVKGLREPPGSQYMMQVISTTKYARIPVPVLAIFVIPHMDWTKKSTDVSVNTAVENYFAKIDLLGDRQAKSFEDGVPGARVIRLRGKHYIFMSNTEDVLREMNAFLAGLN